MPQGSVNYIREIVCVHKHNWDMTQLRTEEGDLKCNRKEIL